MWCIFFPVRYSVHCTWQKLRRTKNDGWLGGVCVGFFSNLYDKTGSTLRKKINWLNGHYFLQDFFKVIHFSSGSCSKTHIQMQERFQKSFILTRNFLAVKTNLFNSINQVFVRHCKGTQFVSNSFFNT